MSLRRAAASVKQRCLQQTEQKHKMRANVTNAMKPTACSTLEHRQRRTTCHPDEYIMGIIVGRQGTEAFAVVCQPKKMRFRHFPVNFIHKPKTPTTPTSEPTVRKKRRTYLP